MSNMSKIIMEKCSTHHLGGKPQTVVFWMYIPLCRRAAGWVWLYNSLLCWVTSGMTFDSGVTSHSALTLAPAAGHSTTGLAGHSLRQPGGGSGSDQLTRPKHEDHQTATVAARDKTHLFTAYSYMLPGIQYTVQYSCSPLSLLCQHICIDMCPVCFTVRSSAT